MSEPSVLVERHGAIARVILNRPEKMNALDLDIRTSLLERLAPLVDDDKVRAIVLSGQGGNFCAGGDINTMQGGEAIEHRKRMKHGHRVVRMLYDAEKPVVAAVEGYGVGAGAGLALAADLIVMGEAATIGFPFFRVGLIPDWGILHTLPRRVGVGRAKQALLTARMLKGPEALAVGLCDLLVPDAEVLARAMAEAERLAAQPRHAFALVKRQLHLYPTPLEESLEMEALGQALGFNTADFREGRAAFLEKRKPEFD